MLQNDSAVKFLSYFLSKSTKLNLSSKFISSSVILIRVVFSENFDFTTLCGTFVLNFSSFQLILLALELKNLSLVRDFTKVCILYFLSALRLSECKQNNAAVLETQLFRCSSRF